MTNTITKLNAAIGLTVLGETFEHDWYRDCDDGEGGIARCVSCRDTENTLNNSKICWGSIPDYRSDSIAIDKLMRTLVKVIPCLAMEIIYCGEGWKILAKSSVIAPVETKYYKTLGEALFNLTLELFNINKDTISG